MNKVEYGAVTEQLNKIRNQKEEATNTLKQMDELVNAEIGTNGASWAGDGSATQFKASWDSLAERFNDFTQMIDAQANNIENLLRETTISDDGGSVQVNL